MEDKRPYEIRVWDEDAQLLYIVPTLGLSEREANAKGKELLALRGGHTFTVLPLPGRH